MEEYSPTVPFGSNLLNSGRTLEALVCFLEVRDAGYRTTGDTTAELEQLLGICYRMLNRSEMATQCFERAIKLTDDRVQRGRIWRDWSMLYLAGKQYDQAGQMIEKSRESLERAGERLEYAATMDFIGRLQRYQGNREGARLHHRMSDEMLRRNRDDDPERAATYELNNLVWWLKDESGIRRRVRLTKRALRLAAKAGNRSRQAQVIALLICRPLILRIVG